MAGAQLADSAAKEPWGRGGNGEGQAAPSSGPGPGSWANGGPPCWPVPASSLLVLLLPAFLSSLAHKGEFRRPSSPCPSQEEDMQKGSSDQQSQKYTPRERAVSRAWGFAQGLWVLFECTLGQPGLLPTSGHPAPPMFLTSPVLSTPTKGTCRSFPGPSEAPRLLPIFLNQSSLQ